MIIEEVFESTIGKVVGAHCSRLTAMVVPGLMELNTDNI